MAIRYLLDAQGGFTAGDTETGLTSYAYPSSMRAKQATLDAPKTAAFMIEREAYRVAMQLGRDGPNYDARNWATLDA